MALYWPDQKVALQIDDDPAAMPFDGPDDWTVIHTTKATLGDFDSFKGVMTQLGEAVGADVEGIDHRRRFDIFRTLVQHLGDDLEGSHVIVDPKTGEVSSWDGDAPEGSLEILEDGTRMSTPEFYYLREARHRTLSQQIQLGYELCGLYGTDHLDNSSLYDLYPEPVTSVSELRGYLRGARDLDGYKRAMEALNYVAEGALSPATSYLTILLTLPRRLGGYDLPRPSLSTRLLNPLTLEQAPTDEGRFEVYDLCWQHQGVAMQFVGDSLPGARERRALEAPDVADFFVVYVTSRQMRDAQAFDEAARLLADKLEMPLPPPDDLFLETRDRLRHELSFPAYEHMRSMAEDLHWHEMR